MKLEYKMTTFVNQMEKQTSGTLTFKPDEGEENQLLNLYPQVKYQSFEGFGGSIMKQYHKQKIPILRLFN